MVGYGGSIPQGVERDISLASPAGYLARWMAHLDLEPAILAGPDLDGGAVQKIAAARDRGRCLALFLTNAICTTRATR
jgi:pimeloyl-ACP methyl ester carboxylesterase